MKIKREDIEKEKEIYLICSYFSNSKLDLEWDSKDNMDAASFIDNHKKLKKFSLFTAFTIKKSLSKRLDVL